MKITDKQKEEVDFLSQKWDSYIPTDDEIIEYIKWTVYGNKTTDWRQTKNRLFLSKRTLDMTIKMWREDLKKGLIITKKELIRDEKLRCKYYEKLINSL